ncbi:hypothetical protein VNO77_20769 [Canavalia gladiata]|uniref:Uncharacterized protein n=1 Tax=Canavalia gladiata TaxID=3824 RepID=A0AAN9LQR2_CANGL
MVRIRQVYNADLELKFKIIIRRYWDDRLDTMEQPHLFDAISNYKVDAAQDLQEVLNRIESFISCTNLAIEDAIPETKALAKGLLDILSGNCYVPMKIVSPSGNFHICGAKLRVRRTPHVSCNAHTDAGLHNAIEATHKLPISKNEK